MPAVSLTFDIHCVTKWSKFDTTWTGVRAATCSHGPGCSRPRPTSSSTPSTATPRTCRSPTHHRRGARRLRVRGRADRADHGGPVRIVVPHLYFWKIGEVGAHARAAPRGPARVLGAQRLPRVRRPVPRAASLGRLNQTPPSGCRRLAAPMIVDEPRQGGCRVEPLFEGLLDDRARGGRARWTARSAPAAAAWSPRRCRSRTPSGASSRTDVRQGRRVPRTTSRGGAPRGGPRCAARARSHRRSPGRRARSRWRAADAEAGRRRPAPGGPGRSARAASHGDVRTPAAGTTGRSTGVGGRDDAPPGTRRRTSCRLGAERLRWLPGGSCRRCTPGVLRSFPDPC